MKKLPLGMQTFSEIIQNNYLYIDKTKGLYSLITDGKYFFLSRPRRFGKSLLLSTLKELFSGNRELFKDLYIYDKIEWAEHPVLHFDLTFIDYKKSVEIFERDLYQTVDRYAAEYSLELTNESLPGRFRELIQKLSVKNKVVILIDEYDKPIIDFVGDYEKAKENREVLRSFYSILKGADEYLRFVFLTGVSKFSKVSIFSGLNNIKDITLVDDYATLLGITKDELETYFEERITQVSEKENISESKLLEQIKYWYNGYSWNGIDKVYNPTSLLNFFDEKRFGNYWFTTGTPTFLIETIREYNYEISEIEETEVGDYILDSYDIDHMDVNALLLQAGYLTIKEVVRFENEYTYILTCPNYEVKHSLFNYLLSDFTTTPLSKVAPQYIKLKRALIGKDLDTFITIIRAIFAKIPYNLHLPEESYYHSLFYLMLSLIGVKINLEVLTDKGRIDGVLELDKIIYVIEFKRGTAQEAVNQISDKKYYESYLDSGKEIFLLGVGGFDNKDIQYICKPV